MGRMFRLLRADEIECRVSRITEKGLFLLLYKDARVDQNILDETVGHDRWQRKHELINGNLFCNVGIWFDRDTFSGWVWKQDVGTESNTEKEKGQASDAFKRACFNWGIGRELYTAPRIWISAGNYSPKQNNGKLTTYDHFVVSEISYTDDRISSLVIVNEDTGKTVYKWSREKKPNLDEKITEKQVIVLRKMCLQHRMPEETIFGHYGHKSMEEMTVGDWTDFGKVGQAVIEKWDKEHADENDGQAESH